MNVPVVYFANLRATTACMHMGINSRQLSKSRGVTRNWPKFQQLQPELLFPEFLVSKPEPWHPERGKTKDVFAK